MPAIRDLRSRVQVYRAMESPNERAEIVKTYALSGYAWTALAGGQREFRNEGAGEAPAGTLLGRAATFAEILPADVLRVVAGDHRGSTWRVGPITWAGGEMSFLLESYTDPLPCE